MRTAGNPPLCWQGPSASCRVASTTSPVGGRFRSTVPTNRQKLGTPELSSPSPLPLLDRGFDVIFMVVGDNKAGIVHKFS
jgi:hypothetical protein